MEYKTDEELRKILEAEKNAAGGVRRWAKANKVSPASISVALYQNAPFPPKVAGKLGYEKAPQQWVKKKPGKKTK